MNAEPIRFWILAPVIAGAVFLAPIPAWVVDQFYSRDMYPWLQGWFTTTSNLLPFAVMDLFLSVALVAMLFRARRLFNVTRERGVMDAVWEAFRRTVRAVSIIGLLFLWGWGCNYRRLPLEQGISGGGVEALTPETLRAAVMDANALAARLRPVVAAAKGGPSYREIAEILPGPMDLALKAVGRTPLSAPGRPKYSMFLTPFFTRAGVSGMVNPLALESIVHPDLLPFERPFVLAHEWAHLAGQADEAEASAVGWLACMHGPPALAYSASLYLIMEASAALPSDTRRTLLSRLDAGVRADLEAIGRRQQREHPVVQRTASRVYDEYLRFNSVEDGTTSYRRALTLIMLPALRDKLATYGTEQQ